VKPIEEIAQSIVDEMDITDLMAMAIVDTEAWLKDMGADGELQKHVFWITYPHIVCNPKMYHL
jgi:hypothetical protein